MAPTVSRASFLRGGFRNEVPAIRPPWAFDEPAFTALCDGCRRCSDVCPEKIIVTGRGGLPEMNFAGGGCSFCGDCVGACPIGALIDRGQAPWRHKAQVGSQCLSWQGVVCRLCRQTVFGFDAGGCSCSRNTVAFSIPADHQDCISLPESCVR